MSIAVEKSKQASERFLLVRLNPGRFLTWSSLGSGIYSSTPNVLINKVERNGTALTKDSTWPTVNDHWYQDETTKEVRVKTASAPDSTSNILIVFYYLFYTGNIFRALPENPEAVESESNKLRDWEPRIANYPQVANSFDNIINGVFTISSSTIDLINEAGQFQEYLSDDDSFFNKEVRVWLCITDVSNIKRIFNGTVSNLSFSKNIVSLSVLDDFKKLKQPATMGDAPHEIYYTRSDPLYPNIDPKAEGLPSPYIIGRDSRYKTDIYPVYISGGPDLYRMSDGNEAFSTNYTSNISTSTNRSWLLCRQKGVFDYNDVSGTVTAFVTPTAGITYVKLSPAPTKELTKIGDTVYWFNAGTFNGIVGYIGTFVYSSVTYDMAIIHDSGTVAIGNVFTAQRSIAMIIKRLDGSIFYPKFSAHYTNPSNDLLAGGNYRPKITFINNFESGVIGVDANKNPITGMTYPLNPDTDKVLYRISDNPDFLTTEDAMPGNIHDRALKRIIEKAGLTCNNASFLATQSIDDSRVMFQIPNFDEYDYDSYLKYVQDILSSTLGYVTLNDSNEVEYNMLEAPISSTERNSFNMIDDGTSATLDYQDMVTSLIAYNPHNSSVQAVEAAETPSITEDNNKARYLHGLLNVNRFRHVMETINDRIAAHIGLKSSRKVTYKFETATEDIDTELGDDLQLDNKIVLGTSDVIDVKVTSIEKSPSKTRIEASDLKGL